MCGSIFVSRPVLKCCRTPRAPLLGCLGPVSATQTCDITVKDEYIYLRRGVHREREGERVLFAEI